MAQLLPFLWKCVRYKKRQGILDLCALKGGHQAVSRPAPPCSFWLRPPPSQALRILQKPPPQLPPPPRPWGQPCRLSSKWSLRKWGRPSSQQSPRLQFAHLVKTKSPTAARSTLPLRVQAQSHWVIFYCRANSCLNRLSPSGHYLPLHLHLPPIPWGRPPAAASPAAAPAAKQKRWHSSGSGRTIWNL